MHYVLFVRITRTQTHILLANLTEFTVIFT